jgi:hypothetical protein
MITNIQKNHEKPVILIWTTIIDRYKRGRLTCEQFQKHQLWQWAFCVW